MLPVIYMMFSVLVWSLFPLVSIFGISDLSVLDYIVATYLVSFLAIGAVLLCAPAEKRRALPSLAGLGDVVLMEIAIGCVTVLLSLVCLLTSYTYISKAGATVIFEVWPIIAMYITPLLISKNWERITAQDLMFSVLAFAGIAFLMYPETQDEFFVGGVSAFSLLCLLLPLLGGVFMAVASVLKARVSHKLENKALPVLSLLKVQMIFNLGVIVLALPAMLVLPDRPSTFTIENIMAVIFIGLVVHTLGNVAYTMGVLRSTKSNISVLWYLMPIFSVVWLWLAGQSEITNYVVLGTIFIITSNLIIAVRADNSMAYASAIVSLLLCGVYTYFVDGLDMPDYYQAISVPVVLYAILVAFAMDRLIRRDRFEEGLAVSVYTHIAAHKAEIGVQADAFRAHVVAMVKTPDLRSINAHYRAIRNAPVRALEPVHTQLDQLVLSKAEGANFGEMFILFMVGVLMIVASCVYRPESLIADIFAIVLSVAVVFIFFTVLDLIKERQKFHLEEDGQGHFGLSGDVMRSYTSERVISALLILLILAALVWLLVNKHHL